MKLDAHLIARTRPLANSNNIIKGDGYRITVLTPQLIRVEQGSFFTDEATQAVWFRDFPPVHFTVKKENDYLYIITEKAVFWFDKKLTKVINVTLGDENKTVKCGNAKNLKGTYRTLDGTWGWVKLNNGIMSKSGVAVLDDSKSLLLVDGEATPRKHKTKDLYIFAYGKDYLKCLQAFFKLTGEVPLIPRYALGNWWSRYRAYTQQEYIDLMEKFKKIGVPITVATVDMDWHWVDVNEKFNAGIKSTLTHQAGWTGYSWNTDLFPDYKAFLKYLHDNNYKTTLNLHPADGVRWFEDMYKEIAQEMGVDYKSGATVEFDITDSKFINSYFKILHNPYEDDGVDFWWIDWQQGKKSKVKGLDPLWSLNHYHFLNSQRNNKRGLILSRYGGVGSHRYPLGFSGDTFICWRSYKFQPYFTSTAANIGYTWWSHDIGGHMFGIKNDELYLRWLQFGVFSPINRLHSTSHDLLGKEPWNYSDAVMKYAIKFLKLRHRLIPYIYSINHLTHKYGLPLCQPLYYAHPEEYNAYKYKNQYYFGPQLLVAPITEKINKRLAMGKTKVWLPKGRWTDIFTGRIYNGDRELYMFRGLESLPVLAKEGSIIPFADNEGNDCSHPKNLTLYIYRGNGEFELYEDDGETLEFRDGKYAITAITLRQNKALTFTINKARGDLSVIPEKRHYKMIFKDIADAKYTVEINDIKTDKYRAKIDNQELTIEMDLAATDSLRITFHEFTPRTNGDYRESAVNLMSKYQASNVSKMFMYRNFQKAKDKQQFIAAAKKLPLWRKALKYALLEILEE